MRKREAHDLGNNFFDYEDDKEALIHEDEVAQALVERDGDCLFSDPVFPASAESLYRTPQQPPAGVMSPSLVVWARISRQEVRHCHSPVTFPADEDDSLSAVTQGALENLWLVNAMNILLSSPDVLKRTVVSDRHKDKGIYTLKLFNEGSWRYMHVDDRLPCFPSRGLYFCSSENSNQVWAPLIEKAFAKLHGCYESLGHGSIEEGLRCVSGVPVLRNSLERMMSAALASSDGKFGGAAKENPAEKHRKDLWSKIKRWHDRGCAMGCCRSVAYDRARTRKRMEQQEDRSTGFHGGRTGHRRSMELMPGRGYGVQSVREVSAGATPTCDAIKVRMVQIRCTCGPAGQWRGDWSKNSGMWERYPSIRAELRPERVEELHTAGGVRIDGGKKIDAGQNVSRGSDNAGGVRDDDSDANTFWMSLEDFSLEFSQLLTCVSFSSGQGSNALSRKSYRGRWQPGDHLTGSGGGCISPYFLQNPFYPVTIQHNSTTLTVSLSVTDKGWQADPSRVGPAIGYYILRLTGSKPRLTKMRHRKIAAKSESFVVASQIAGEHVMDSGRYAIVPITVHPLHVAEAFVLDLAADNTVDWEQVDDRVHDLDEELKVDRTMSGLASRLSDDEAEEPDGKGPVAVAVSGEPVGRSGGPKLAREVVEREDLDTPPGDKVAEAVHRQIADLSSLVAELTNGLHDKNCRNQELHSTYAGEEATASFSMPSMSCSSRNIGNDDDHDGGGGDGDVSDTDGGQRSTRRTDSLVHNRIGDSIQNPIQGSIRRSLRGSIRNPFASSS